MSNYAQAEEANSMHSSTNKEQSKPRVVDQLLKRSTYNIYEAYDEDMSSNSLLDSSSIHPLQTDSPYSMDLSPTAPLVKVNDGDLTHMMKDLDLSSPRKNTIEMRRASAMPYCV